MTRTPTIALTVLLACACSKKSDEGDKSASDKAPKAGATKAAPAKAAPAKAAPDKPAPTAKAMTPLQVWEARKRATKAMDGEALKALYAPDAAVRPVGSGMEMKGPEEIVKMFSMYTDAFPDLSADYYIVLDKGPIVAAVARTRGTHKKPMMGMPATNKSASYVGMEIIEVTPEGKIARETLYADNLDFMAQLGFWEGPHRPYDTGEPRAEQRATSTDGDAEKQNLAVVESAVQAFNGRDSVKLSALYGKDAVLANQSESQDYRGGDIETAYQKLFAAFPDVAKSAHKSWAAGDFVVSTYHLKGTHKGPYERFGMKAGTDKAVEIDGADVYRMDGGKIAEHWVFIDGMYFAITLGAMKMPGME